MRTRFFFPPLPKISGGMAVIAALAAHLAGAGHDVALVLREPRPALQLPGLDLSRVPLLDWEEQDLRPDDLWVVPEGWPNALVPGLTAGARCLVYVQNWAFLHGTLPEQIAWRSLPVHYLAVSHPVAWYVAETTGAQPEILRPGLDLALFRPEQLAPEDAAAEASRTCRSDGPARLPRIAWMPRKNKALAMQIRHTVEARLGFAALEWVEIHGKSQSEVAELLRGADIFLATGFPEGCPLPPLEALASGCLVVGFSGFGGWDYMRQALPEGFAGRFEPWWPPRPDLPGETWGGNGLYVADADVMAAALALEYGVELVRSRGPELARVRSEARRTAARYSLDAQKAAALTLWDRAVAGEIWTSRHA